MKIKRKLLKLKDGGKLALMAALVFQACGTIGSAMEEKKQKGEDSINRITTEIFNDLSEKVDQAETVGRAYAINNQRARNSTWSHMQSGIGSAADQQFQDNKFKRDVIVGACAYGQAVISQAISEVEKKLTPKDKELVDLFLNGFHDTNQAD